MDLIVRITFVWSVIASVQGCLHFFSSLSRSNPAAIAKATSETGGLVNFVRLIDEAKCKTDKEVFEMDDNVDEMDEEENEMDQDKKLNRQADPPDPSSVYSGKGVDGSRRESDAATQRQTTTTTIIQPIVVDFNHENRLGGIVGTSCPEDSLAPSNLAIDDSDSTLWSDTTCGIEPELRWFYEFAEAKKITKIVIKYWTLSTKWNIEILAESKGGINTIGLHSLPSSFQSEEASSEAHEASIYIPHSSVKERYILKYVNKDPNGGNGFGLFNVQMFEDPCVYTGSGVTFNLKPTLFGLTEHQSLTAHPSGFPNVTYDYTPCGGFKNSRVLKNVSESGSLESSTVIGQQPVLLRLVSSDGNDCFGDSDGGGGGGGGGGSSSSSSSSSSSESVPLKRYALAMRKENVGDISKTIIHLRCDESRNEAPNFEFIKEELPSTYYFSLSHAAACPSFIDDETKCYDAQKKENYCLNGGLCVEQLTGATVHAQISCCCGPSFDGPRCESAATTPQPTTIPNHQKRSAECCQNPDCSNYRGNKATTATGRTCQPWNSDSPHGRSSEVKNKESTGSAGLTGNFCRNPSNHNTAWCYTMDENKKWEDCTLPRCAGAAGPAPRPRPTPRPPVRKGQTAWCDRDRYQRFG